jgi:hypothetical protein
MPILTFRPTPQESVYLPSANKRAASEPASLGQKDSRNSYRTGRRKMHDPWASNRLSARGQSGTIVPTSQYKHSQDLTLRPGVARIS